MVRRVIVTYYLQLQARRAALECGVHSIHETVLAHSVLAVERYWAVLMIVTMQSTTFVLRNNKPLAFCQHIAAARDGRADVHMPTHT